MMNMKAFFRSYTETERTGKKNSMNNLNVLQSFVGITEAKSNLHLTSGAVKDVN